MVWKKLLSVLMSSVVLLGTIQMPVSAQTEPVVSEAAKAGADNREVIYFNTDWKYKKGDVSGAGAVGFSDEKWDYVNLPHSTTFYTAENKDAYLGISWYRKRFSADASWRNKKVFLTFEAAMQKSDVYLNGELIRTQKGGYVPFVLDISGKINYDTENVIAVKIDSRGDSSFAPGKDKPDFQYFGGIYGNSYLTVTDPIHISDAVEAGVTAGGGVFITAPKVSEEEARLDMKTHVENETDQSQEVTLVTELLDKDQSVAASEEKTASVPANGAKTVEHSLTVTNPRLWAPDSPELYTVRSTVKVNGNVKDIIETSYGIRKVEWKREGLFINGVRRDTNGANLHAETYMLGNAMPDNAIYEEIRRFKEYGFDILRMSHYPHRQAYYDACDKYGVMIVECPSGWQYFSDSDSFKESTYQELRTDIRHNRNHPSIVAWESSLNESHYTLAWAQAMREIVREEYPVNGAAYAYTAGCYHWNVWDIGLSTPQAGIFGSGSEGAENAAYADKPIIIAEYGDWNYGGTGSTTRVTREKINSAGKAGGDEGMLIQADNIQEAVQVNRAKGANWLGASMYWDYADYAGFDTGMLTYCGVVDLCRIPKHGAYFYQSQRSAEEDLTAYGIQSGPMVYIANLWDQDTPKDTEVKVRIYSNCDTVELFLNGKSLGEKGHDTMIYGPHGDGNHLNYPASGAGKEIKADALVNAPITFTVPSYEAGELKAVGKTGGTKQAEYIRRTPGAASRIALRPENEEKLPLDGSSAKLVWIDVTDENGTVVTDDYSDISMTIEEPGLIVGPDTITTKAGQLAVWVRSRRGTGNIVLRAEADNMRPASISLETEEVNGLPETPEGGDQDEFENQNKESDNIFLNKKSSSSTNNTNGETNEKANDGDENTKWCASGGSYPQWWEADLGTEYTMDSMQLSFETAGSQYYYAVSVSDQPMTDVDWKSHIVKDCRTGSAETYLQFDTPVKGRYVRVTFAKGSGSEWAVLREVSGTGVPKNIAIGKTVSASSVNNNEKAEYAIDGDPDTQWCAKGGTGTKDHWFMIDLKNTYQVSQVNIQFESEDAAYKFVLQTSLDGKHFRDIKDFRNSAGCGKTVSVPIDRTVQYVRIYDISTKDPQTQWPVIQEMEILGEKVSYQLENIAREKEAFASSSSENGKPGDGNNGVPNWYWYPAGLGEEWWYVDTKGLYDLDNIQMTWEKAGEHKYRIDISTDKKNWITVADRSEQGTSEIIPYEQVEGTARYIRVTFPSGRSERQGFGLFGAYSSAPQQRAVDSITAEKAVEVPYGTAFLALPVPKEVEVRLEDGIQTLLPVTWSDAGYNGEKPGVVTLTGTLSEIEGVSLSGNETVSIDVKVGSKPADTEPKTEKSLQIKTDRTVLGVKEKMNLQAVVSDHSSAGSLTFKTSNPKVITVNGAGKVTAKKKGKAVITVTSSNGLQASITLNVKNAPKKITLKAKKKTLKVNESIQLKAVLSKKSAGKVTYKSSSKKIATVSSDGTVTAKKKGKVKITAKTYNKKSAQIILTVK